jgi:hypothetical protein
MRSLKEVRTLVGLTSRWGAGGQAENTLLLTAMGGQRTRSLRCGAMSNPRFLFVHALKFLS